MYIAYEISICHFARSCDMTVRLSQNTSLIEAEQQASELAPYLAVNPGVPLTPLSLQPAQTLLCTWLASQLAADILKRDFLRIAAPCVTA